MKINKLQINDFGKFSNKEIQLDENLNIIKGKNESGKSTIQKFIVSMLYGISKDKRKSSFTDYEKYYPWGKESFSGKITYTLENNQKYEVFRDFTKKMPIVYNENAEDITSNYGASKGKGSSFFEEQTGVDEKTMLSSMITEQGESIIDQSSENFIIQKLANMTQTGNEKISYENAQAFLTKKRNEEVGTEKTKNRPINILTNEKEKLLYERDELEEYVTEQYELEEKIKQHQQEIERNEKLLKFFSEYKRIIEEENEGKNKIDVYRESLNNNKTEKNEIQKQINDIKAELLNSEKEYNDEFAKEELEEAQRNDRIKELNKNKENNNKKYRLLATISGVIAVICIVLRIIPATIIGGIVSAICLLINSNSNKKSEKEIEELLKHQKGNKSDELHAVVEKVQSELKEKEIKIEIINKNNDEIQEQISELESIIKSKKQEKISDLLNKYDNIIDEYKEIMDDEKIASKIQLLQKICNDNKLELQKYYYRKDYIIPKLERMAEVQESLYDINEKFSDLEKQSEGLLFTSTVLKEAYEEMKEKVVPRFTENLSKTIASISNGKYSKVITNDKEGLIVEKQNGEYIPAKALSTGTIDQLYLSLRLSISREASNERMPIILDEAFAYYDSERLSNILDFISHEFNNNQIILFTCTSREIYKMNELGIKYNLIEI